MSDGKIKWRKGTFLNPFCQLVIKAVRVDSPPCMDRESFAQALDDYRRRFKLNRGKLAVRLGISLGTLKNWEAGRTKPVRHLRVNLHKLISG